MSVWLIQNKKTTHPSSYMSRQATDTSRGRMRMEVQGKAALVTGGGSGIGRSLCLALAQKGVRVSIVDYSESSGKLTDILEEEHAKSYKDMKRPTAIFIKCDVTNPGHLASAFAKHLETFGRLDICINSAGISGDEIPFIKDKSIDGCGEWRRTIDVNLTSLIDCTRLAIQIMEAGGYKGTILNIGSASGLYPAYNLPIYGASKGGVVMFSRSLSTLKHKGIRVNVLCPEVWGRPSICDTGKYSQNLYFLRDAATELILR